MVGLPLPLLLASPPTPLLTHGLEEQPTTCSWASSDQSGTEHLHIRASAQRNWSPLPLGTLCSQIFKVPPFPAESLLKCHLLHVTMAS